MKVSLRTKIAIFVTLIIFIFSAVSTYLFILQHKHHMEKEFISRGLTLNYLLSKIAVEGLAAERLELINRAFYIIHAEDVKKVMVYTELWDMIESYPVATTRYEVHELSPAINHFKTSDSPFYIRHGDMYDFFGKVTFQPFPESPPITVGFVQVDLSTSGMQKATDNMVKTNILTSWIITVIAVLLLNILIRRLIGKPVMYLHNSVRMFKNGVIPEIKTDYSHGEIGDLAREFNEMSRTIKEKENLLIESERNIASLFERVEHAIFRLDKEGNIIKANRKFNEIFGEKTERLCDILMGEKRVGDYFESGVFENRVRVEERVLGRDGRELIVLLSLYPDVGPSGRLNGFDGYMLNITERKRAEENIRLAAKVMESALEGIFITDSKYNITAVNPSFKDITGLSLEEVKGRNPAIMAAGHDDLGIYREVWDAVRFGGIWQGEIRNRHKSGVAYIAWLNISAIKNNEGNISNYVGVFTDITRRKITEDHLKRVANYDMLTGLPNRVLFNELLSHAVVQAKRDKKKLAVMFLDLDNFKTVNDTYGHDIGDMLLQEVAQRLKECIRQSDTVSRLSGDEFAVILNQIGDISNAVFVAQKILLAHSNLFYPGGFKIKVGVSIGISLYPEDSGDAEALLKNADAAMYLAKNSGKNNYRFFSERTDIGSDVIK
ncbi:MAG: sensor domain-containing diguanylate cyclase [Nitrospiraceae bacterium]|nr:MAG: sensor domain-containing diguanylate cyclase [Nitrospiraceae bacterium]